MKPPTKYISLMTYNIHKGFGVGRMRFLLPKMKQAIAMHNPDFVFLQEVQGEHKRREKRIDAWPKSPQVEFIAEEVWPYYVYAKNATYQSGHHGNAILSKWPIENFENIQLTTIDRASRGLLHSQLTLSDNPNDRIHLLCVHLGLFKSERAGQCRTLMQRIREVVPEHEPLIMAGDFNDWRLNLSQPLEKELGIQEAFYTLQGEHARSFPAIRPSFCVDRIYYRGMEVCDVECLQGRPWRMLSDHLPLYARFKIR